jgi:hypothetical protein
VAFVQRKVSYIEGTSAGVAGFDYFRMEIFGLPILEVLPAQISPSDLYKLMANRLRPYLKAEMDEFLKNQQKRLGGGMGMGMGMAMRKTGSSTGMATSGSQASLVSSEEKANTKDTEKDKDKEKQQPNQSTARPGSSSSSSFSSLAAADRLEEIASISTDEVIGGAIPKRGGFTLRLISGGNADVPVTCYLCNWMDRCAGCVIPDNDMKGIPPLQLTDGQSIAIDWHFLVFEELLNTRAASALVVHSSVGQEKAVLQETKIPLSKCLDKFNEQETLEGIVCPTCHEDNTLKKSFMLWRLPPVLIVQLKRFQFDRTSRKKLNNRIDFPLEDLDLKDYLAPSRLSGASSSSSSSSTVIPSSSSVSDNHNTNKNKTKKKKKKKNSDSHDHQKNSNDVVDTKDVKLTLERDSGEPVVAEEQQSEEEKSEINQNQSVSSLLVLKPETNEKLEEEKKDGQRWKNNENDEKEKEQENEVIITEEQGEEGEEGVSEEPLCSKYDLYSVIHHIGALGGGHYVNTVRFPARALNNQNNSQTNTNQSLANKIMTSFGISSASSSSAVITDQENSNNNNNNNEESDNPTLGNNNPNPYRWFNFNDNICSEITDLSDIASPSAYVLFYLRKDLEGKNGTGKHHLETVLKNQLKMIAVQNSRNSLSQSEEKEEFSKQSQSQSLQNNPVHHSTPAKKRSLLSSSDSGSSSSPRQQSNHSTTTTADSPRKNSKESQGGSRFILGRKMVMPPKKQQIQSQTKNSPSLSHEEDSADQHNKGGRKQQQQEQEEEDPSPGPAVPLPRDQNNSKRSSSHHHHQQQQQQSNRSNNNNNNNNNDDSNCVIQ